MAASEFEIDISEDGVASTLWWTTEAAEILSILGPPSPGFEDLNQNPWCG
jgi:hypothetical protein